MAPEVFRDASLPRTVKYDVYSFGILLWELLSGQKPFEAGKCCLHFLKFYVSHYKCIIHVLKKVICSFLICVFYVLSL